MVFCGIFIYKMIFFDEIWQNLSLLKPKETKSFNNLLHSITSGASRLNDNEAKERLQLIDFTRIINLYNKKLYI